MEKTAKLEPETRKPCRAVCVFWREGGAMNRKEAETHEGDKEVIAGE